MIPICLAFHAHLPWRLRPYNYFDVGTRHSYFDAESSRRRLARTDALCFAPAAALLDRLLKRHPRFAFSLALSGPLLDQLEELAPGRLAAFRRLVETGRAEPLSGTSHHCLSFPVSSAEVEAQLRNQNERLHATFGRAPAVVGGERPWDLDAWSALAGAIGIAGTVSDSAALPRGSSLNQVYRTAAGRMSVLPRANRLSDDLAVRFSSRRWDQWPLTAEKLDAWIASTPGDVLCLSLDLSLLGLAHPSDSGIFEFFETWVETTLSRPDAEFLCPSEVFARFPPRDVLHAGGSFAASANEMQQDARAHLAALERKIHPGLPDVLLEDFRRLTGSDHFEAMALRAEDDRAPQARAFESPYEAYMTFRHVVSDLERRIGRLRQETPLAAGTASA